MDGREATAATVPPADPRPIITFCGSSRFPLIGQAISRWDRVRSSLPVVAALQPVLGSAHERTSGMRPRQIAREQGTGVVDVPDRLMMDRHLLDRVGEVARDRFAVDRVGDGDRSVGRYQTQVARVLQIAGGNRVGASRRSAAAPPRGAGAPRGACRRQRAPPLGPGVDGARLAYDGQRINPCGSGKMGERLQCLRNCAAYSRPLKPIHGLRCRLSKQHVSGQDTGEVSTTRGRQEFAIAQIVPTAICGGITLDS